MTKLLVQPGCWNSFNSSAVESLLLSTAVILGYTQKRKDFLKQVYSNIHGSYTPDNFYHEHHQIIADWPLTMKLRNCMKFCDETQKKQLKIWYTELLLIEPMEELNPMAELMLPIITNTINTF